MPVRLLQTNAHDREIQAMMRSIKYYEKEARHLNEIICDQADKIEQLEAELKELRDVGRHGNHVR